jgi:UDP-N-acetylglucosamine 4,6-dehydratase
MSAILITGGSGSFGRAMAKRLIAQDKDEGYSRVIIYSRNEHAQAEMRQDLKSRDTLDRLRYFIGDVRDRERLVRACRGVSVVLHAAALKRIEVGAYNPTEMVKTNIGGAINVVEAAHTAGVEKVVALSTDKAWQPISPYGQSKALAETIFLSAYQRGAGPACAVTRYGNVWKSKGSVVPYWQSLINQGCKGVPVTDPDCTRFYMTMDEALDFVLETVVMMKGGELRTPTLPAYRLGDLVEAMGARAEILGLPNYEKKHEGMCDGNTSDAARRMTITELRGAL